MSTTPETRLEAASTGARGDPLPLPPLDLAGRVGPLREIDDPLGGYLRLGEAMRSDIETLLGEGWSWQDRRVLDFGCGAGRLLRHFAPEARAGATFLGCDSHPESVDWLRTHLCPPLGGAFVNSERPPLELHDGTIDLVIAASVFTHIYDHWAEWLLEVHRVLTPGGLLVASFVGAGESHVVEEATGEPYRGDETGMNVLGMRVRGAYEAILVVHSPWWLRAHWGRAFEIVTLTESGFADRAGRGHGLILARRRDRRPSPDELRQPEPGEPREWAGLHRNVSQLLNGPAHLAAELREQGAAVVDERDRLKAQLASLEHSRSLRLTRPLRWLAERARRLR